LTCVAVIKCLRKGVAGPHTCGVPSSVSWELFYSQSLLCDWLLPIAWRIWLVKISQLEINSCLGERTSIQILHMGWSDAPARYQPSKTLVFWIDRRQTSLICTSHVSINSSVLRFGSIKSDSSKEPYYSVLANEVIYFASEQIKSLWTVEVVLISSSGLASSVQFPVASVIAVIRSW
jgi:hypothetical protein